MKIEIKDGKKVLATLEKSSSVAPQEFMQRVRVAALALLKTNISDNWKPDGPATGQIIRNI